MSSRRAIVLSDLHMGPAGGLASFRDGVALHTFLDGLTRRGEPPAELLLAGDIFDFLQVPGYDGFDPTRAEQRFDQILTGPETARVLGALKRFAHHPGSEITVLSGNHDPELLLPGVREMFERAIECAGRVRYADDTPLWPGEPSRMPIWGRALGDDAARVWVVHGDRWDTCNAIHRDELRARVAAGHPVDLPVGSKLVYQVLNELQPQSRWIPYLKPDPVVLPLLLYLDPRVTLPFLEQHWGLAENLFGDYVRGWLKLGDLFGEGGHAPPDPTDVTQLLSAVIAEGIRAQHTTDGERDLLLATVWEHFRHGSRAPTDGLLAAHGGVRRALLRAWLVAARYVEQYRDTNGSDGILDDAERWLPAGVVALLAGHTHGPRARRARRVGQVAYFNTGTWIPVGKVHDGPIEQVLDDIEAGRWEAEAPRTFAAVTWGEGLPSVQLRRCDAEGRVEEIT